MSSKTSFFESLPASVLNQILVLLPPLSLISVSRTSRFLRSHSQNDLLWAKFVKESVPNYRPSLSPFSCDSWKELYISHYPFWFLPQRKIWFSDKPSNGPTCKGEVVIARYDPQKGRIEAYRLLAEREDYHFVPWERDPDVMIYTLSPKVSLSRDDPVIKLDLGWRRSLNGPHRETLMQRGGVVNTQSSIALCQAITVSLQVPSMALWPPETIPATQRVQIEKQSPSRSPVRRSPSMAEASDSIFQIPRGMENRSPGSAPVGEDVMTFSTILEESYIPTKQKPWQGIWVGDYVGHGCQFLVIIQKGVGCGQAPLTTSRRSSQSSLTTLASAEAANDNSEVAASGLPSQTITAVNHRDGAWKDESPTPPEDGSCWGRLEAIKLTGDPNVPRGEYSWIAEDIGPRGLLRIANEQMFKGARVLRSVGHSLVREFQNDRYEPSQLIMISHDSIAHYWEDFGFICFYSRVNIDDYLDIDTHSISVDLETNNRSEASIPHNGN